MTGQRADYPVLPAGRERKGSRDWGAPQACLERGSKRRLGPMCRPIPRPLLWTAVASLLAAAIAVGCQDEGDGPGQADAELTEPGNDPSPEAPEPDPIPSLYAQCKTWDFVWELCTADPPEVQCLAQQQFDQKVCGEGFDLEEFKSCESYYSGSDAAKCVQGFCYYTEAQDEMDASLCW